MKVSLVCFIVILSCSLTGNAQRMNKVQAECFILGTLGDYMGRNLDPRERALVDRYYAMEGPVVDALEPIIKSNYPKISYKAERYKDEDGEPVSYKIYSDSLAKMLNSYYVFTAQQHWTDNHEEILLGRLNADKIKTEEQQLAFLAGVYARFGVPCDTAYHISIPNSISKVQFCKQLLTQLNGKPYYQFMPDFIPNGYHLYFHPPARVKSYLAKYSVRLNNKVNETKKRYIERIVAKYDAIHKEVAKKTMAN